MSPRTGRPKVENPQDQRFSIRLDAITCKKIDEYSRKSGKTRAKIIREAIQNFLAEK